MSNRRDHFSRAPDTDGTDQVLESWIHRELSRLHDQVLHEPVPAEILLLLAAFDAGEQEVLLKK